MRMKIVTMIVCILLIVGISVTEQISVSRIAHGALSRTQAILADIRAGELEEANKKAQSLDRDWDGQAKLLEILVDHGSTDDVRYALSKLIAALESGDYAAAMIYAGELEGGVEHVHERQAFTLENLF